MRILLTGASGMIGTAVRDLLAEHGDHVTQLVRRPPVNSDQLQWDPAATTRSAGRADRAGRAGTPLDPGLLENIDAIINLSGASISRMPWTSARKKEIVSSRLTTTQAIVTALQLRAEAKQPLPALVNASAVGYYGSRPGHQLTEEATQGTGFLAGVVSGWECAALRAPDRARVVLARTGLVLGPGGAMKPLVGLARIGLGGRIGNGRQCWPWISLRDEAAALRFLAASASIRGPVNLVGPQSATASEITRGIAHELHRPHFLPAPAFALSAVLGEAGRELLLAEQNVVPRVLLDAGFTFMDSTPGEAIATALHPQIAASHRH